MRVIAENAEAIYIEQPGPEYEGFEFSLETHTGTEYHQAKRQKTGEGRWDLGALAEAGVLHSFFERLHETDASCVFASAHAAYELEELSDRARKAESFEQFRNQFLASAEWQAPFRRLSGVWKASDDWTWQALRRVHIRTVGEETLKEQVTFETEMRLSGGDRSASGGLIEVLRDSVNERLTAANLWERLKEVGLTANPLTSGNLGVIALNAVNDRFERSRSGGRINNKLISRTETDELRLALDEERIVLVQGHAGMGKSEVLSELLDDFKRDAVPHLVVRLDRLNASATATQIGAELGLSASPAVVLAGAAAGQDSYLVVDQLDALSTTSGRNPEFLDAVAEMLRQGLVDPRMRIVLACRSFDANNDARLRQLFDKQSEQGNVTVGPLAPEQVRKALDEMGVDQTAFDSALIELLSVPLHLSLMGQISARSAEDVGRLKTLNDLYAEFWHDKHEQVRQTLKREPRWTDVLDALVDWMSEEQSLDAARVVVDEWSGDVDAMLSAGVLVEEDGRVAFFHETFFDYVFARRFSARRRTLEGLLNKDQFLFRRAQVRQILAHSREISPEAYASGLRFLLVNASVRFHLKDLVLAWLQTVNEPRDAEWRLIEQLLEEGNPIAERAWLALCSPQWFRYLNGRGLLTRWLTDTPEQKAKVLSIISSAGPEDGAQVARLLAPLQEGDELGEDLDAVLLRSNLADSRDLFDLLLKAIDDDAELGRRDFWYLAHELPEQRADWACELLGSYLAARLACGELIASEDGPFRGTHLTPQGLHLREYVTESATRAPAAFIDHVWPVILAIIERTVNDVHREGELRQDAIWGLRHFSDSPGDLDDDLLAGAERAFAELAKSKPKEFEELLREQQNTPYESVVFLLFHGLAANPALLADQAIDFLVADPRRFRVGYSDAYHWGTRRLLEAVSSDTSLEALQRLEEPLLGYFTPWERSVQSKGRQFGMAQFEILGGIPEDHRTPAMEKRFAELQRKFGVEDAWGPHGVQGGMVTSPIAEASARKMSDANWLRAMRRYASEDHAGDGDFLKGGASQLASVLEKLAGEEPARFAQLALQLPDEIHIFYFDAILRGVGGGEQLVPLTDAEALIERCHALPDRPCGQWIAHPLRPHAKSEISDSTLAILRWYATEGESASNVDYGERNEEQLLSRGLNSVRGGMASELARLVRADAARLPKLETALRRLCTDESMPVRAMAAETILAVFSHDPEMALRMFLELTQSADDAVLTTRSVRRFMVYRGAEEYDALEPLIRRMVNSPVEEVRSEGAAQAGLAALSEVAAQPLANECLSGAFELRLGTARVFAHNLNSARHRDRCTEALADLFNDDDADVRKAAAEAIQHLKSEQIAEFIDLIEEFLGSQAFEEHAEMVMFALQDAPAAPVDLSVLACQRVLDMLASGTEIRRGGAVAHEVSEVLIRAYVDAADAMEKNAALDVIDRALALNAYGAQQALREHDRG